jgi:hypothetical protein
MSKIFETQFEKGSYIDCISGTSPINSNITLTRTEKGISTSCSGVTSYLSYPTVKTNLDTVLAVGQSFTGELWVRFTNVTTAQHMWQMRNAGGDRFVLGIHSDGAIKWSELGGSSKTSGAGFAEIGKWYHCIFTWDNTTSGLYINGVEYVAESANSSHYNSGTFIIGAGSIAAAFTFGYIPKVRFYDHLFTPQERSQAYNEFLNAQPLSANKFPRHNPHSKPTDLSNEPGLVAAYNMIPSNGTLVDISGNGNNGTINGSISSVDGLVFDGVDNNVDLGTSINSDLGYAAAFTICVRFKKTSNFSGTNEVLFGSAIGNNDRFSIFGHTSNSIRYGHHDGVDNHGVYADFNPSGDFQTLVVTNNNQISTGWYNGVVMLSNTTVTTNGTAKSTIGIRQDGTLPFDGEIEEIKIYNYTFTQQQAEDYHNSFARRPVLVEDFSLDAVSTAVPQGWQKGTGTYEIKELAAQDSVLKHLDVGTKYLEATGAGTIAIQSKAAYGTWEWDFYKSTDIGEHRVFFIADKIPSTPIPWQGFQGYGITFFSNEGFYFQNFNGVGGNNVLMNTDVSYCALNTWYRMKITRTKDGEWYIYVKGGAFGDADWTLMSVVGGSGTNPVINNLYTTGEKFLLDLDAGDRLTNLIITKGVQQ